MVAHDVALVGEVAGKPVHGSVRLLDEETVAIELAHLGRERKTKVVPARLLPLAELVRLRALAEATEPGDLGERLLLDPLLDDRGDGLEARRVTQQRLPVRNLKPLDLLGGLDLLLRSQNAMADHLSEVSGQRGIAGALPLELLERFLALDACLLELFLAGLSRGRGWGSRLGRLYLRSFGLRLRLRLGCLGPHLALPRGLSCHCLSCHLPLAFRWRPKCRGAPSARMNTRDSRSLPRSFAVRSNRKLMHASCRKSRRAGPRH